MVCDFDRSEEPDFVFVFEFVYPFFQDSGCVQLVAKVTDVVGLHFAPPENAIVLCVDEKSQIQALARHAPTSRQAARTDQL